MTELAVITHIARSKLFIKALSIYKFEKQNQ